jgi:hypothetical protein
MTSLDYKLEVFKEFDRSRLNCLDKLQPYNEEWVIILKLLFNLLADGRW